MRTFFMNTLAFMAGLGVGGLIYAGFDWGWIVSIVVCIGGWIIWYFTE